MPFFNAMFFASSGNILAIIPDFLTFHLIETKTS
jgi:hypothetical protein